MIALPNPKRNVAFTRKQRQFLIELISEVQYLGECGGGFFECVKGLKELNEKQKELEELMHLINPDDDLF